jgi:hypothetical protein
MIPLLLLLLQRDSVPTVGDTIWLTRRIHVASGQNVRAGSWEPSGAVELLGRAEVRRSGNEVMIRYPAVAWEPGEHVINVPGPVLVSADGRADSLPAERITLRVASVLPAAPPDSVIPVQPQAGLVRMREVSARPMLILWGIVALILLPVVLLRRRRGHPRTVEPKHGPLAPPVERWADAGESRAVTALAAMRLREALAAGVPGLPPGLEPAAFLAAAAAARPEWPFSRIDDLLHRLDDARFALAGATAASELYAEAEALARELGSGSAPEPAGAAASAEAGQHEGAP